MSRLEHFFRLSVASLVRDRLLHLLFVLALLSLFLIPAFSMFSMRQVQELSVTLSLSAVSFLLLILTVLTGASAIWRDVERRYTFSVLGLPVSRADFVLGKFFAIVLLLAAVAIVLGGGSIAAIKIATSVYPSDIPVNWMNYVVAIFFDYLKYVLLLSVAFVFSAVSTSFYLPFLGTIAIFMAGSASQEVYEFVTSSFGRTFLPAAKAAIKAIYYVLPNLAAFDLKPQAIYALPLAPGTLLLTLLYFVCYTGIMLSIAVWSFSRRELP